MGPARPRGGDDFPWWLVVVGLTLAWMFWEVQSDALHADILSTLAKGIRITVIVTIVSYVGACVIGLALALGSLSRSVFVRQAARLYVEVMRGVPILVLLIFLLWRLVSGLQKLTGLETEEILLPR